MSVYNPGSAFTEGEYEYWGWHDERRHAGIDFLAEEGTAIPAAARGTVVGVGFDPTYGNTVIIRHPEAGEPPYRYTLYAHMTADVPVTRGMTVLEGATIGYVGDTGTGGNGVMHLHFELLHLDFTWETKWLEYNYNHEHWRGDPVPLGIDNPEGRVDPHDDLNWVGVDVYTGGSQGTGLPPIRPNLQRAMGAY